MEPVVREGVLIEGMIGTLSYCYITIQSQVKIQDGRQMLAFVSPYWIFYFATEVLNSCTIFQWKNLPISCTIEE